MALCPPGSVSSLWINEPAPAAGDLLTRVFRMAHSTWARDFLFFPNPNVDAGILTSARHLQYKVAGKIKLHMKADRIGPYNSDPYMDMTDYSTNADDRLYADWVMVPAFNFGHQGACYFMHKQIAGPLQDSNGAVRSALYRIITDDITGEVLYVGYMPETDTFQVVHMRHISGALHERAICFFEGSVFRQAIVADEGKLSMALLAKAMTLCIHTRETRICIVCKSHPAAGCMCHVTLRQAEHPHDMRFYGFNARTHLGQYQGKQYLMYMKNGQCIFNRMQLTQHRTDDVADRYVADGLRLWAVQDRLGSATPRISIVSEKDRLVLQAMFNQDRSFDDIIDDLANVDNQIDSRRDHIDHTDNQIASDSSVSPMNVTGRPSEVDVSHDLSIPPNPTHPVIRLVPDAFARQQAMLSPSSELAAQLEATHIMMPAHQAQRNALQQQDEIRAQFAAHHHRLHLLEDAAMEQHYSAQKRQAQERCARRQFDEAQMMQLQAAQHGQHNAPPALSHLQVGALSPPNTSAVTSPSPIVGDPSMPHSMRDSGAARAYAQDSLLSDAQSAGLRPQVDGGMRAADGFTSDSLLQHNAMELSGGSSPGNARGAFGASPRQVSCTSAYAPPVGNVQFISPMGGRALAAPAQALAVGSNSACGARYIAPMSARLAPAADANLQPAFGSPPAGTATVLMGGAYANGAPFSPGSSGASSATPSCVGEQSECTTQRSGGRLRARRRLAVGAPTGATRTAYPPIRERRLLPRGNQPAAPTVSPLDRELELRIRKREAARRSDQRRLQRVQQLREETLALEARAAELREREAQLRDENKSLRHKVAQLGRLKR